jgi:hypothetical protein
MTCAVFTWAGTVTACSSLQPNGTGPGSAKGGDSASARSWDDTVAMMQVAMKKYEVGFRIGGNIYLAEADLSSPFLLDDCLCDPGKVGRIRCRDLGDERGQQFLALA